MKKFIITFLIICTVLCGCGNTNSSSDTLVDKMLAYNSIDSRVFTTTKGTEMYASSLEIENTDYSPRVVLTLNIGNTYIYEKAYNWCQMSIEERKADLKECGDMVVSYAKSEDWDNDYYLYVNVDSVYDGLSVVYDYEEDWLYVPDSEIIYMNMYEQFNTLNKWDLEDSQEGIDFLINNDLAYLKHNEVEYKHNILSGVYIHDGEFSKSIDDDEYTIY